MHRLATKSVAASRCARPQCLSRGHPASVAYRRYNSSKSSDRSLRNLETLAELAKESKAFPNLMQRDSVLDDHETLVFPPNKKTPYENRVVIRNERSIFDAKSAMRQKRSNWLRDNDGFAEDGEEGAEDTAALQEEALPEGFEADEEGQSGVDEQEMDHSEKLSLLLDISARERGEFYRFPLVRRIVKHQTGKGKVSRFSSLVVVGNGDGLVGYGEAKDAEGAAAFTKSLVQAYRNLDHVERYEQRTLWTEMSTKLGATQLIIRPRPVGFGLRCNPYVHQVLKAAGIKDASVKVWGSRNPGNVVKALFRVLHAGNAPLAMGNGAGGGARKLDKGVGMRSALDIERERGRRMLPLAKRF